MKAVHLMNSAMMPQPGRYTAMRIDKDAFCRQVQEADRKNKLKSYIGYPKNVELIQKWTGIGIPVSRAETHLEDGDSMLVMKLKYRPQNVGMKSSKEGQEELTENDFEFFLVTYNEL